MTPLGVPEDADRVGLTTNRHDDPIKVKLDLEGGSRDTFEQNFNVITVGFVYLGRSVIVAALILAIAGVIVAVVVS